MADPLTLAIADPDDGARIASLAEVLRRLMEEDPAFAEELEAARLRAIEEDPEFRGAVLQRLEQTRVDATAFDEGVSNGSGFPSARSPRSGRPGRGGAPS